MAELSPMMQQYLEIKNQHKDEILFYRIGDFYEMFFDDAVTASRELDLTLTGKQCGLAERAPMCGVPFHSYEGYVARLIAKGYKVAICEQVEDPAKAKGLVKRDIIRVVTPGTVIESSMLQDDRNNYIASLYLKGKKAGLCFADVSTGTAHITELTADKIAPAVITELCRYHPSEVLLNPGLLDCREVTAYIKKNMSCSVELVEDERYAPGLVASALEEQFGRDWPQTTGMVAEGLVRFAMAALLEYLHDTQIKGVERLKTVITYNEAQFMRLSPVTRANLELTETLRAWVRGGGAFVGVGEPSSLARFQAGRFFQLADVLGVDEERHQTLSVDKYFPTVTPEHFITADVHVHPAAREAWEKAGYRIPLSGCGGGQGIKPLGGIDFGEPVANTFPVNEDVTLLRADGGQVQLAVNEYGKGRGVYVSGLPYSAANARLLERALFWASHNEDKYTAYSSTNPECEVAVFDKSGCYCVVNNTDRAQSTYVERGDGRIPGLKKGFPGEGGNMDFDALLDRVEAGIAERLRELEAGNVAAVDPASTQAAHARCSYNHEGTFVRRDV